MAWNIETAEAKLLELERALSAMRAFATAMVEKHDMNGDNTMSDAEHAQWQEASAAASKALNET